MLHHVISPSKLPRIQHCVGSLYGPGFDEGSEAAREGTACHALLEYCLAFGDDPRNCLGSEAFSTEFPVNIEMIQAVELFIDTVKGVCDEFGIPHDRIKSEEKLVHPGIPGGLFGGTMDCRVPGDRVLIIADLKFGRRQVYADSLQLTAYSLLSVSHMNPQPDKVVQLIIQPRGGTQVSRHEPGQEELSNAWNLISYAAEFVTLNPDLKVRPPVDYLNAGEHCKYCPQRVGCPARDGMVNELVTLGTFTNPNDMTLIASPTQELSTEVLVEWMQKADVIAEFLADVKKMLLIRASQGDEIPGHKLVVKYGHRKWNEEDDEAMAKKLPRAKLGLTKKDIMVSKMATPAQVEKILKERGILKDKELKDRFNRLTVSPPTGVKLVLTKDRGEAVRPETALEFLKTMETSSDE